jgi:hypothetical protein
MSEHGNGRLKGRWAAILAAAAVTAFAASNLYVFGLSLGIHQSLANYFEMTDYIQITPSWALPALYLALVASVLPVFDEMWRRRHPGVPTEGVSSLSASVKTSPPVRLFSWKVGAIYLAIGIVMLIVFKLVKALEGQNDILPNVFIVVGISWTLASFSYLIVDAFKEFIPGQVLLDEPYRTTIAAALVTLCFAFAYGVGVAPKLIRLGQEVTVNMSPIISHVEDRAKTDHDWTNASLAEKGMKVTGRIIVMLPAKVILQTTGPSRSFMVIPKEKIESIEIPIAFLKPVRLPTPTPAPTLAPTATPTSTPTPTPMPSLTPTATPTPTSTPTPTAPPTPTPPPASLSVSPIVPMPEEARMSKADRLRVQGKLHRLGYYKGRVDGGFGRSTRAAIRRFQHDIGAKPTGHLTAEEASRLVNSL